MDESIVLNLAKEALTLALLVSAPMLGLGLLIGLVISIIQATTQIQEQTLTFVPKIIAVMAAIILFGPWMLRLMLDFTSRLWSDVMLGLF